MPLPNTTQSMQQEGRIALAMDAIQKGHFTSARAAAKSYDVGRSTLQNRVNGRPARRDSRPTNRKLTDMEESTLVQWILSMDQRGLSPRSDFVRQMANLLIKKRSDSSQGSGSGVGKLWVHNFVRRHQALLSRYNRKYDYQRAKCEDLAIIREWFHLVRNTIAKYSILDEDIYNFDETGFQIGVITTAKVITRVERSNRPVSIQPRNRE